MTVIAIAKRLLHLCVFFPLSHNRTFLLRGFSSFSFFISVFLSGMSTLVQAAPIAYSEAISGDLPYIYAGTGSTSSVLNLGTGQNTVSGQLSSPYDFDAFAFTVPSSTQLNSISLSFSQLTASGSFGLSPGAAFGLSPGIGLPYAPYPSGNFAQSVYFSTNSPSPTILFPSATPLGAGTYTIGDFVHENFVSGYENYTYTLNVQSVAPPPPPTTLDLAKFSDLAYPPDPGTSLKVVPAGYAPLINNSTNSPYGFDSSVGRAIVYSNGTDVVIAFKGTSTGKDFYSDTSWNFANIPSPELMSFVSMGASLIHDIATSNPWLTIDLTGHSLGGAVAQLLGAASGLHTETFNAPGTSQFLNESSISASLANLGSIATYPVVTSITNHRVYGDIVSTAGTQIGDVITHDSPIDLLNNPCNEMCAALFNHNLSTMVTSLKNDPAGVVNFPDGLHNLVSRVFLLSLGEGFITPVAANIYYLLDPPANYGQEFSVMPGSPLFRSIGFGYAIDFLYELELFSSSGWYEVGDFLPGTEYMFGAGGVDRFRVFEVNQNDFARIPLSSDFIVAVTFASDGVATIEYAAIKSIPEPSTLALLASVVMCLVVRKNGRVLVRKIIRSEYNLWHLMLHLAGKPAGA